MKTDKLRGHGFSSGLQRYRAMTAAALILRLAQLGAVAGLVSWTLALALSTVVAVRSPTGITLVLAVLRGAGFGVVAALLLRWRWSSR